MARNAAETARPTATVLEFRRPGPPRRLGPARGDTRARVRRAPAIGLTDLAGPLTATVAPFAEERDPTMGTPDPASVMAGLIDLRGGVNLAEALAHMDAPLPERAPIDPAVVRATLHAGLADIEARLDDAFTHAFRPRYRLPDARRGWQIVKRAGLPGTPKPGPRARKLPRPLVAANRHLWAPFAEFLETHLKRARFALRDLRDELIEQLEGLGPDAARLVRLDCALVDAMHGETEKLYRRVPYSAELAFTARMREVFMAWSDEPTEADFAPGFGPDGWLGDLLADAQRLARAVVHHERARLEALVESACALATPRD